MLVVQVMKRIKNSGRMEAIYPLFHTPIYSSSYHPSIYIPTHPSIHMSISLFIHPLNLVNDCPQCCPWQTKWCTRLGLCPWGAHSLANLMFPPVPLTFTTSDEELLDVLFLLPLASSIYLFTITILAILQGPIQLPPPPWSLSWSPIAIHHLFFPWAFLGYFRCGSWLWVPCGAYLIDL